VASLVVRGVAVAGIIVAVGTSCGTSRHETILPSSFAASQFSVGGVGIEARFPFSSFGFEDMYASLGDPGTARDFHDGAFSSICVVTWPKIGLRMVHVYGIYGQHECSRDLSVDLLVLSDRRWHSWAGLHVGDTTARLERLYPQAIGRMDERIPDQTARRWDLEVGPPQRELSDGKWITVLPVWTVAFTSAGHVRYLVVAPGGAADVFPWSWSDLWERDAA
jgi:hypothetical protein